MNMKMIITTEMLYKELSLLSPFQLTHIMVKIIINFDIILLYVIQNFLPLRKYTEHYTVNL